MSETKLLHRVRILAGLFLGLFLLLSFRGEGDPLGQTDQGPSQGRPVRTYQVRGVAVSLEDMRRFDDIMGPRGPRVVPFRRVPGPLLISGGAQTAGEALLQGSPGNPGASSSGTAGGGDGGLSQPAPDATAAALPLLNAFAGVMDISLDGLRVIPPDTDGAVGPSNVVTLVNRG